MTYTSPSERAELIEVAAKAYYEGSPILSDEEFDGLCAQASWDEVGYTLPEDETKKFTHTYPLYSLQKHYEEEGASPLSVYPGKLIATPKLDGASVALSYGSGKLVQILTRGDGKEGVDITEKFIAKGLAPSSIPIEDILIQVVGEVVSPKSIPNSRNYAAGSLNLKSIDEFVSRDLSFIVHGCSPFRQDTFSKDMELLSSFGFSVVTEGNYDHFPQDGIVYRIDNNKDYQDQGKTSHHPKGAFALKERKTGVETTLLDVVWQVGKSGVISPVAILDPIVIDGANISRATLHNIQYIQDLNLEIGCQVEVIRSGDIIPRIIKRIEK